MKALLFLSTLLVTHISAQNYKIKKGEIFIGQTLSAKVKSLGDTYSFFDPKDKEIFNVTFVDRTIVDSVRDVYIEVERLYSKGKKVDADYVAPNVFAGDEKIAVHTAVHGYQIIDKNGINIEKLDFLFTDKYKRKLDTKTKEAYDLRKKLKALEFSVNQVGEIFSNGKKIGFFANLPINFDPNLPIADRSEWDIEIFNTRSQKIGMYSTTEKRLRTSDNKVFTLYREVINRHSIIRYPTYVGLVERLYLMNPSIIKS